MSTTPKTDELIEQLTYRYAGTGQRYWRDGAAAKLALHAKQLEAQLNELKARK